MLVLVILVCVAAVSQQKNNIAPLPDAGNVSIPLDEYNKLVDLASKDDAPPKDEP